MIIYLCLTHELFVVDDIKQMQHSLGLLAMPPNNERMVE